MSAKHRVDLPLEIWALATGHLRLSGYGRRYAEKFETIGDLVAALDQYTKLLPARALGARREIHSALVELSATIEKSGLVGWHNFPNRTQDRAFAPLIAFVAARRVPFL